MCEHFLCIEGSTDLVMVDHDVCWEAGALLRLVDHPVDVVAGVYPHRKDPITYPVAWLDREDLQAENGLLEVAGVPAGFLRLTRSAVERMTKEYSLLEYLTDKTPSGRAIGFFEPYRRGKEKLSEDYSFCARWRDIGGRVWVDPEISMAHTGNKAFSGHLGNWLRSR